MSTSIPYGGTFHIECVAQADYDVTFIASQDDAGTQPIPLTGWHGYAQVRERKTGTLMGDCVVTIPSDSTGQIKVHIPGSMTAGWKTDGVWDLFIQDGSVPPQTLKFVSGNVFVEQPVTQIGG